MDIEDKYGMKDIHLSLLQMLDKFLTLCQQNGIVFSMGFGSMLGAIRHKGFIPWDDDIDIIIDRDNFKILSSLINTSKDFELVKNVKKSLWIPRIKKRGLPDEGLGYEPMIDLFLVDHLPDSPILAKMKKMAVLFVQGMIKGRPHHYKGSVFLKIASFVSYLVGLLFPMRIKYELLERLSTISNCKETKSCSTYNVEYLYVGRKYVSRLLKDIIMVGFEGRMVPVSKHYDSYLTELYGDYMIPPKENERVPKHQ